MVTTWIVQRSLGSDSPTLNLLTQACATVDRPLVEIAVIPFSAEMPALPEIAPPFVFYGYTTLIRNAYQSERWRAGVFFDPESFRPAEYLRHYGDLMLNADMEICTFAELSSRVFAPERELFIRPNDDFKQFTGQTMTFAEFQNWFEGFPEEAETSVTTQSELTFCTPKEIYAEWRLFLVDGRVVGASQYQPVAGAFVPAEVIAFGERSATLWSPMPVFVMDVAQTEAGLKIIELNCFNGSGFYLANVEGIVRSVSRYLEASVLS
jgi:hypothetical protein